MIDNVKKKSFYLILVCCIWACRQEKSEKYEILQHSDINKDELFIGRGGYMVCLDSGRRMIGIDNVSPYCFFSLNTDSVNHSLCNFGNKGQGPEEFIDPFSLQYIDENTVGCFDVSMKNFSEFSVLPDCSQFKKTKVMPVISAFSFSVVKTADNQYIGIGPYEDGMFVLFDSIGNRIQSFFEYPYRDNNEKKTSNRSRSMAYQGHISTNPDRNRFAYAASYSDIIHFYEIAKADIRLIKKIENSFPEYIVEEKNGGVGAPIQSSNKNGYICVYSTNRYVYLLYSGRTWRDYQGQIFEADLLKIYDWKGNLQNTLQLDVPCRFFCVNPDDKKMWAITYNPDPSMVGFDLPDIAHSE